MGTVVAPPAGRVVHFLQRTMWSYSSSLWAYHRNAADPRRFWASAKATLNLSRQSTANPAPLTDPATNSTCFDPQRICQIFGEHYKRLAADPTGHSTDPEHWPRVPFSRPVALTQ
ncbi:hypothetical protein HK105_209521, partial [Polyrhizophydium stewartii]